MVANVYTGERVVPCMHTRKRRRISLPAGAVFQARLFDHQEEGASTERPYTASQSSRRDVSNAVLFFTPTLFQLWTPTVEISAIENRPRGV